MTTSIASTANASNPIPLRPADEPLIERENTGANAAARVAFADSDQQRLGYDYVDLYRSCRGASALVTPAEEVADVTGIDERVIRFGRLTSSSPVTM